MYHFETQRLNVSGKLKKYIYFWKNYQYYIALTLNRKIHLKNGTSSLVQSSLQPFNTIMNI